MKTKTVWEHIRHVIRKESPFYREQQRDLILLGKEGWEAYCVHSSKGEDTFFMKRVTHISNRKKT